MFNSCEVISNLLNTHQHCSLYTDFRAQEERLLLDGNFSRYHVPRKYLYFISASKEEFCATSKGNELTKLPARVEVHVSNALSAGVISFET